MLGIEMSVMMRSGSVSMAFWNPACPSGEDGMERMS
jgi:hypothetical protein